MRSLPRRLYPWAWSCLPLLLLAGCVEGQKPTPLKRAAPTMTTTQPDVFSDISLATRHNDVRGVTAYASWVMASSTVSFRGSTARISRLSYLVIGAASY